MKTLYTICKLMELSQSLARAIPASKSTTSSQWINNCVHAAREYQSLRENLDIFPANRVSPACVQRWDLICTLQSLRGLSQWSINSVHAACFQSLHMFPVNEVHAAAAYFIDPLSTPEPPTRCGAASFWTHPILERYISILPTIIKILADLPLSVWSLLD